MPDDNDRWGRGCLVMIIVTVAEIAASVLYNNGYQWTAILIALGTLPAFLLLF